MNQNKKPKPFHNFFFNFLKTITMISVQDQIIFSVICMRVWNYVLADPEDKVRSVCNMATVLTRFFFPDAQFDNEPKDVVDVRTPEHESDVDAVTGYVAKLVREHRDTSCKPCTDKDATIDDFAANVLNIARKALEDYDEYKKKETEDGKNTVACGTVFSILIQTVLHLSKCSTGEYSEDMVFEFKKTTMTMAEINAFETAFTNMYILCKDVHDAYTKCKESLVTQIIDDVHGQEYDDDLNAAIAASLADQSGDEELALALAASLAYC